MFLFYMHVNTKNNISYMNDHNVNNSNITYSTIPLSNNELSNNSLEENEHKYHNFSMYVENIKRDNHPFYGSTPPKKDYILMNNKQNSLWVNHNYVYHCQTCEVKFSIVNRKHHCRACGRVICWNCCKYTVIPNYIVKPKSKQKYQHRQLTDGSELVCTDCYNTIHISLNTYDKNNSFVYIGKTEPVKKVNSFGCLYTDLLENEDKDTSSKLFVSKYIHNICEYLDTDSLYNAMTVSKLFRNTTIHYLKKFREIQYQTKLYDKWQLNMILSEMNKLIKHNGWFVCVIKAVIQMYILHDNIYYLDKLNCLLNIKSNFETNTRACWILMCSRKCNISIDLIEFVDIIKFINLIFEQNPQYILNINVQKFILKLLEKQICITNEMVKNTISIFFHEIDKLIKNILLDSSDDFINQLLSKFNKNELLYFLIEAHYKKNNKIISCIYKYYITIYRIDLQYEINKMVDAIINLNNGKNVNTQFMYPLDWNYTIIKINKIERIRSNTNPILITALLSNNKEIKFIIKKDNALRKERIVSSLVYLLQDKLFKQAERNRIDKFEHIPTYQIAMITETLGTIEFVENSITLGNIEKLGMSLQNYIEEHNPNETNEKIKITFLQSFAISSCMTFIMGIGDRHLDNIMVNKNGQLFNIDFGYLLDNPITSVLSTPSIKITDQIINCLGGKKSKYYTKFKKYVVDVYDLLRVYKNIIIMHYELLDNEGFIELHKLEDNLDYRFMNGITAKDLDITLIKEIEKSNNLANTISDMIHGYKQTLTNTNVYYKIFDNLYKYIT